MSGRATRGRPLTEGSLPRYTDMVPVLHSEYGPGVELTCKGEKRCGGSFTIHLRFLDHSRTMSHTAGTALSVPCAYCMRPSWLMLDRAEELHR